VTASGGENLPGITRQLPGTYPARAGVIASGGENLLGITRQLPGTYPA